MRARLSKGYTLIEVIITIAVISVIGIAITGGFSRQLASMQHHYFWQTAAQLFQHNRVKAITQDRDSTLTQQSGHMLSVIEDTTVSTLKVPNNIIIHINNRGSLGFKGSGNARKAGTVSIQSQGAENKIKVGVGHAAITME